MADYIEICEKAVRRAGAVLLDRIGRVSVWAKGRADLVTDADLASQEIVRQTIREAFADHVVLSEEDSAESDPSGGATAYRWILDPLDGTTNYVHQVPFFGVSLALEHAGQLLVGAVYDPSADTLFTGVRGQGAYCNGARLRTSTVATLADALVSVGFPAEVVRDSPDLALFNEAVLLCQSMRRTGSLALNLAYLAAGRFDVVWSWNARVWDVAAGMLLIREAGGLATLIDGSTFPLAHGPFLAAANATLHEEMVALVRRTGLATG